MSTAQLNNSPYGGGFVDTSNNLNPYDGPTQKKQQQQDRLGSRGAPNRHKSSNAAQDAVESGRSDWLLYLPITLAALPVILSLYYGGRVEQWNEGFLLVIVAFYLYALVKVPWDLYRSCERYSISSYFYLALGFAAPLSATYLLQYVKQYMKVYSHVLMLSTTDGEANSLPLMVFILSAYIRPLQELNLLLTGDKVVSDPVGTVSTDSKSVTTSDETIELLSSRVKQLEEEVALLKSQKSVGPQSDGATQGYFDLSQRLLQLEKSVMERVSVLISNSIPAQSKRSSVKEKFIDFCLDRFREFDTRLFSLESTLIQQPRHLNSADQGFKTSTDEQNGLLYSLSAVFLWFLPSSLRKRIVSVPQYFVSHYVLGKETEIAGYVTDHPHNISPERSPPTTRKKSFVHDPRLNGGDFESIETMNRINYAQFKKDKTKRS